MPDNDSASPGPDAAAWVRRGRNALLVGEVGSARAVSERALQIDGQHAEARLLEGLIAEHDRRYRAARDAYRRAADGGAGPSGAWTRLGATHLFLGEAEFAVRTLRRAVSSDPEDPVTVALLGQALYATGAIPEAVVCFHGALQLLDEYAPALRGLSRVARVRGETPAALTFAERACRIDAQDALACVHLASIHAAQGNFASAFRVLDQVQACMLSPYELLRVAEVFEAGGMPHEARTHFDSIAKMRPRTPPEWCAVAQARSRVVSAADGVSACDEGKRESPTDIELDALRIGLLIDSGQTASAARVGRELAGAHPRHPEVIEAVLQALLDAMLFHEARCFFVRVVESAGFDERVRRRLRVLHPLADQGEAADSRSR